jgi:YVTN family beta-propeller protein
MKRFRLVYAAMACAVAMAAALAGPAQAADAQRLYVAATSSDKLFIIDAASNDILTAVTVGKEQHGLALTDDGRWVWVAVDGGIVKIVRSCTRWSASTLWATCSRSWRSPGTAASSTPAA